MHAVLSSPLYLLPQLTSLDLRSQSVEDALNLMPAVARLSQLQELALVVDLKVPSQDDDFDAMESPQLPALRSLRALTLCQHLLFDVPRPLLMIDLHLVGCSC